MIFKHAKTSILTYGFRSPYFKINRSMRQGCPISPLLFILQAEPLACAIRKNKNIKGIPLPYISPETGERKMAKIKGYADDSQLFVSLTNLLINALKYSIVMKNPSEQE